MDLSLANKLSADELKQNFRVLTDVLSIKFEQIEDVKDATRDMLVYAKYFYPVYTQQLVAQNLAHLDVA